MPRLQLSIRLHGKTCSPQVHTLPLTDDRVHDVRTQFWPPTDFEPRQSVIHCIWIILPARWVELIYTVTFYLCTDPKARTTFQWKIGKSKNDIQRSRDLNNVSGILADPKLSLESCSPSMLYLKIETYPTKRSKNRLLWTTKETG